MDSISKARAALFKLVRLRTGCPLQNVESDTGKKASLISDMERFKKAMSDDFIARAFKSFGTEFSFDYSDDVQTILSLIHQYLRYLYYINDPKLAVIENQLKNYHFDYLSDYDDRFYYLLTLETLVLVSTHQNEHVIRLIDGLKDRIDTLLDAYPVLPPFIKGVINLICGIYYNSLRDFKTSLSYLNNPESICSESSDGRYLNPIVRYFKLKNQVFLHNPMQAYKLIPIVRNELNGDRNYQRLFNLDRLEAIYFISIGEYELANQKLVECTESMHNLGLFFLDDLNLENRIWSNLMLGRYEESLALMEIIESKLEFNPASNCIFKTYCLYQLSRQVDYKQAIEPYKPFRKLITGLNESITLMETLVSHKPSVFIKQALRFSEQMLKRNEIYMASFFLQMAKDQAETVFDYQSLYTVYQKLYTLKRSSKSS